MIFFCRLVLSLLTFKMEGGLPLYNLENGIQLYQNNPSSQSNINGFWLSEKYDGVRAIYLGNYKLVTTRGDFIQVPDWFIEQFPKNIPLDGEIWLGHQQFNQISGLVRSKSSKPLDWKNVKYMVFDLPVSKDSQLIDGLSYHDLTFETRQKILKQYVINNDNIELIKQHQIENYEQFNLFYHQVIDAKGEGVIIIPPKSLYQHGKRFGYKQKPLDDSEAIVVGYKQGYGKNMEITGSLLVIGIDSLGKILPKQKYHIGIGFTQYQRTHAHTIYPLGTIVTCQYNGLSSKGIPRFPRFKGIRYDINIDINIDQIVEKYGQES